MFTETKMRLAARVQYLKCGRIKRPRIINPKIEDDTKGRVLLHIQEDHKIHCQEYTFQEMIDAMAFKAIVEDVDTQYVEQLEKDYAGYKNQNIWTMVKQLQMWYVIMTKETLAIKAHFLKPCSNTPDAHITTFA